MMHTYHCKFCGKPGVVNYEPVPEFKLSFEKWLKIICCDRCGKFHEQKRKSQNRIMDVCMVVDRARKSGEKGSDALIQSARNKLSRMVEKYAWLVCDYLRIQTVSDDAFLEMLMEKPDCVNVICGKYFSGLRKQFPPHQTQ